MALRTNFAKGSQDGSSDNDADETMRDVDDGEADGDGDGDDGEGEGEGEGDDDDDDDGDGENEGEEDEEEDATGDADQSATQQSATVQGDAAHQAAAQSTVRPEALTALTYDIVPTIAAPQSTSINTICATSDARWVFTGGSDGYIRKFNWVDSANNKLALTVAQRHPFVDSVIKAGVLMSYWENWDGRSRNQNSQDANASQSLSPVYSLACHSQALWLLSGTSSGAIRLQSIRHEEGKEIALLQNHTSAISVLQLSSDERSLLSGSWDKTVLDWDLETGQVRTKFGGSASQISSIETRPTSSLPVPIETGGNVVSNGTFSSNNQAEPLQNGVHSRIPSQEPERISKATPDSLFGGDDNDDDLFGDNSGVMVNGVDLPDAFGEVDDEMSRALASESQVENIPDQEMPDASDVAPVRSNTDGEVQKQSEGENTSEAIPDTKEQPLANGLPQAEDTEIINHNTADEPDTLPTSDSTFLATSIDGAIRVWDRRQPNPVARVLPRNTPPWCLSACWSPDGNNIYAGRRNNTVEEYDLRKGLRAPSRIFKFPNGSGAVTSVKAMPNGRHLIW